MSDVWPSLKESGILIYSTCTFYPGENEENIRWMADKHMAEPVKLDISDLKGIVEIEYHGKRGYGFYPGKIRGEGLFISVIKKNGNPFKVKQVTKKEYVNAAKRADIDLVKEWTNFPAENIIRRGDEIYSISGTMEDYLILKEKLKIIRPGTRICAVKKKGNIPTHELALSEGIRRKAFPDVELDYREALAYLKRDSFSPVNLPKGWFIPTYNGINLGFCNNIGSRVNNYYPVEWRIRRSIPEGEAGNTLLWESMKKVELNVGDDL